MSRRIVAVAVAISLSALSSSAFADDDAPVAESTEAAVAAPAESSAPSAEPVALPAEAVPTIEAPATLEDVESKPAKDAIEAPSSAKEQTASLPPASDFKFSPLTSSHPSYERPSTEPGAKGERLRIGALAGVGFPRPFAIEGFAKVSKVVGFGVEYSFLPKTNAFGAETSFKAVAADVRIFPLKNGLFIGLRGGRQWLDVKTTVSAGSFGSSNEAMEASTWFVNPRAGVLHTFDSGITVGVDIGVQVPVGASYARSSSTSNVGTATGAEATLTTVANTLGNKTTPTIDLLRVGFLF